MTLVAGVDSSTQSCKVVVLDAGSGTLVREGRAAHPDGTEVDPDHWWRALSAAFDDAGGLADVSALSVGGQQHGMVLLDHAGNVVRPALLWNDTRSAAAAAALTDEVGADDFARRTGLVPVASFTITKLRWVRDHEPELADRVAAVALPHDWLTWRLRGYGPAGSSPLGPDLDQLTTDRSDASGTGYWSPSAGEYDLELFKVAFGRDAREAAGNAGPGDSGTVVLPRVLGPGDAAGEIHPGCFGSPAELARPVGIRTRQDQARQDPGPGSCWGPVPGTTRPPPWDWVRSPETWWCPWAPAARCSRWHRRPVADPSGTVAGFADASGEYLPIAVTLNAARVLSSVAGLLGVDFDELSRLALEAEPGAGGVVLVPYFEGERTPNLPHAKASFHGLSIASSTRSNPARAAIEGMLCGLSGGLDSLRAQGGPATRLLLIGGAVQNPAVQAIAAQVFDLPVVIPSPGEYVARGAAVQAAWARSGNRPEWSVAVNAAPAPDFQPVIRQNYLRASGHIDPGN